MNELLTMIIGLIGTLAGTVLGWILNSQAYKIGKTSIYATFEKAYGPIAIYVDGSKPDSDQNSRPRYIIKCIVSNSKQIPIILRNFYVEMRFKHHEKPQILSVRETEATYSEINSLKIGVVLSVSEQIISPRSLHQFSFEIIYDNDDITYSRLDLVAYDEKHRKHKFHLYDGTRIIKSR